MEWRRYITSDPKVLAGKPSIKGTRLSVTYRGAHGRTDRAADQSSAALPSPHMRTIFGVNEPITSISSRWWAITVAMSL